MSAHKLTVRFTKNFQANLQDIDAFWLRNGFPRGYDNLLDEIGDAIVPNLERFPAIGRPFLSRPSDSIESVAKQERLRAQLFRLGEDSDMRESVTGDYLLLYAAIGKVVYLLSIRHHKQLTFDFAHLGIDRP